MAKNSKLTNLISFFINENNLKISNKFLKSKDEHIVKDFDFENKEALQKELELIFAKLNNSYLTQICLFDKRQSFSMENQDLAYFNKIVDGNEIFIEKEAIFDFENDYGVKFDIYTSVFEVLLHLINSQNLSCCALHCMEINELFVYIIIQDGQIRDYGINEMDFFAIRAKQNPNLDDIDYQNKNDIYYIILYDIIHRFYSNHSNCNFMENIFIYDDFFVAPEIGYIIYTKLLIKTDIVKINFIQILSDIAFKQLNKEKKSLGKKFKDIISFK